MLRFYFGHRDPALRLAGLQIASRLASTPQGAQLLVPNSAEGMEECMKNRIW